MSITALPEPKKKVEKPGGFQLPKDIKDKTARGDTEARKDAAKRKVCQKFFEGDQYWYVNSEGSLRLLPSAVIDVARGKPLHRIRNTYNYIALVVEGKVSAVSQRIPGFQVDPASSDPEDAEGARIAEQVAFWGFDEWRWRRETNKAITNAIVQRQAFIYPYYDPTSGPYQGGVPAGNIKLLNLTRSEVLWEPGQDFYESRWHAIKRAMLVDDVKALPGYIGGAIAPDAQSSDIPDDKKSSEMVAVMDYMERPSEEYPEGRRCWIADGRIIVDYRKVNPDAEDWYEPYPYQDALGNIADHPAIHYLSYTLNPNGEDLGLVERIIDLQRTINDCWNKLLEWKNRALFPQTKGPRGANMTPRNDIPGAHNEYNPGFEIQWEQVPPIPRELFELRQAAIDELRALAADLDVQPAPDLAAKTIAQAAEQNQNRWQSFVGDVEDFQSRLMRHCLTLVAKYFSQERVIAIRGQYGYEPALTFTGQDLNSQVNVRVLPGTITAKTRQQKLQELEMLAQLFPGAISPEAAIAVMHGGPGENLLDAYERDVAKAWRIVQELKTNVDYQQPSRLDLQMGDPARGYLVPKWMPQAWDNVAVWKTVVASYVKSTEYAGLPDEVQFRYEQLWQGLEQYEQQKAMQTLMRGQDMAAQLGQQNASRPQPEAPMAAPQSLSPAQAAPTALSPKE